MLVLVPEDVAELLLVLLSVAVLVQVEVLDAVPEYKTTRGRKCGRMPHKHGTNRVPTYPC